MRLLWYVHSLIFYQSPRGWFGVADICDHFSFVALQDICHQIYILFYEPGNIIVEIYINY